MRTGRECQLQLPLFQVVLFHPRPGNVLQAPLREAVGPDGERILVKVAFSTIDLEAWQKVAKNYRSDPVGTAKCLRYIIKQQNPDWSDMKLLLDALTETKKR